MARIDPGTAVAALLGVLIFAVVAAAILPSAIGTVEEPSDATFNQSTGDTVNVTAGLDGTLDSISTGTAQITLNDTQENEDATVSLDQGNNETVTTLPGGDVTVNATEVGADYAVIQYTYPTEYGWDDSAGALWSLYPLVLILVPVGVLIGYAIAYL